MLFANIYSFSFFLLKENFEEIDDMDHDEHGEIHDDTSEISKELTRNHSIGEAV